MKRRGRQLYDYICIAHPINLGVSGYVIDVYCNDQIVALASQFSTVARLGPAYFAGSV